MPEVDLLHTDRVTSYKKRFHWSSMLLPFKISRHSNAAKNSYKLLRDSNDWKTCILQQELEVNLLMKEDALNRLVNCYPCALEIHFTTLCQDSLIRLRSCIAFSQSVLQEGTSRTLHQKYKFRWLKEFKSSHSVLIILSLYLIQSFHLYRFSHLVCPFWTKYNI